jgi:hypothetical protein
MNNMYDNAFGGTAPKPVFRLIDGKLELVPLPQRKPSWLRRFFSHSALCRWLRMWGRMQAVRPDRQNLLYAQTDDTTPTLSLEESGVFSVAKDYHPFAVYLENWSEKVKRGWALTLRLLEAIHNGCRKRGAKFILYAYGQPLPGAEPIEVEDGGRSYRILVDRPYSLLRDFCRDNGIAWLEEPIEFRKRFWAGELTFQHDEHLTAEGSRLAAQLIADRIAQFNTPAAPSSRDGSQ